MKNLFMWLVRSSVDPRRTSLTIRMFLLAIVPYLVHAVALLCGFGFVCLGIDSEWFATIIEVIENIVFWSLSIIAGIGMIYGAIRKVWTTVHGTNAVIESFKN